MQVNKKHFVAALMVFIVLAVATLLLLNSFYPIKIKVRATGLNENEAVSLYYERSGKPREVMGQKDGALIAFKVPLSIQNFGLSIDPQTIERMYINDAEVAPATLKSAKEALKQKLKLYFYAAAFLVGLIGAVCTLLCQKLRKPAKTEAAEKAEAAVLPKPANRRTIGVCLGVFVIVFISAFVIIKNDAACNLQIRFTQFFEPDQVTAYFMVPPRKTTSKPVQGDMVTVDIPLGTKSLGIYVADNFTREIVALYDGKALNTEMVAAVYLDNRPVDLAQLPEVFYGLRYNSSLNGSAAMFGLGWALLAVLLTYAGFNLYGRGFMRGGLQTPAMIAGIRRFFTQSRLRGALLLLILCVVVLIWRKPDQIFSPFIIIEDATFILKEYLTQGWGSLFNEVNGYYIVSSKIINFLAFKISFAYYPYLAAFFANVFTILVIFAVAYSPTHLKKPYLCAVLTLLVKSGSECFGVALYSFWWAGLLLILAVLWQSDKKPWLRYFYLLFGGFSAPIILIAAPLSIFRAVCQRNRQNVIAAAVSLVPFCMQSLLVLRFSSRHSDDTVRGLADIILISLRDFFGTYVNPWAQGYYALYFCGLLLVILIFYVGFNWKSKYVKGFIHDNLYYLLLLGWLAGVILASVMRSKSLFAFDIHPFGAYEHRYFFYPCIVLAWVAVWLFASLPSTFPKILLKILCVFMMFNFLFGGILHKMPMEMPKLSWRLAINDCIYGYRDYIPIVASKTMLGFSQLAPEDARFMVENSLFFNEVWPDMRLNQGE